MELIGGADHDRSARRIPYPCKQVTESALDTMPSPLYVRGLPGLSYFFNLIFTERSIQYKNSILVARSSRWK